MAQPSPAPSIKVWRPQGFEGLELELLSCVPLGFSRFQTAYEFSLFFEGRGRQTYLGQSVEIGSVGKTPLFFAQHAGELLTVDSYELPTTVWTLKLDAEAFGRVLDESFRPRAYFTRPFVESSRLNSHLVNQLHKAIGCFTGPNSRLERESRLLEFLGQALRHHAQTAPGQRPAGREHRAVRLTRDYMEQRFSQDIALADLAALAGLSKFHLLEVFKQAVGVSPHVYQTSLRVQHAKQLLSKGTPAAQVALDAGFVDQSHFTNVFKRHVRVTPGRFQRDSLK